MITSVVFDDSLKEVAGYAVFEAYLMEFEIWHFYVFEYIMYVQNLFFGHTMANFYWFGVLISLYISGGCT